MHPKCVRATALYTVARFLRITDVMMFMASNKVTGHRLDFE